MEPASAPFCLRRAVLFLMITGKPPSEHSPFCIHEPAMESVIRMTFSMGFSLKMSFRKSGVRWILSQMSSSFRSSSRSPAPTIPISL